MREDGNGHLPTTTNNEPSNKPPSPFHLVSSQPIAMRCALTCSRENHRAYNQKLEQWDGPGRAPTEDFLAVTNHLEQGGDLFIGLRKPKSKS